MDDPQDKPLTLKNLVNAVKGPEWYFVGLELGIEENELACIELSQQGTERHKAKMLSYWLKSDPDASWEKIAHAVEQVAKKQEEEKKRQELERIRQEESEKRQHEREERLEDLLRQTENVINRLAQLHKAVEEQNRRMEEARRESENYRRSQRVWKREDEQWQSRTRKRQMIKEAIWAGDHESADVKEFLGEKNLPEDLRPEALECYVHKDSIEDDVEQFKHLRPRYIKIQEHQANLQKQADDIGKHKALLEGHRNELTECMARLQGLGVKPDEIIDIRKQLEKVEERLKNCQSALVECDGAFKDYQLELQRCRSHMHECDTSLALSVQELNRSLRKLQLCIDKMGKDIAGLNVHLKSLAVGLAGFGAGGGTMVAAAAAGSVFGPLGTLAGGILGGLAGHLIGLKGCEEANRIEHEAALKRMELAKSKQELEACEETMQGCKQTVTDAEQELRELRNLSY